MTPLRQSQKTTALNETAAPLADALTVRQQRFVTDYLIDLNGKEAAIRAGYSERSASTLASRLLRRPAVAHAIAAGLEARAARARVTADRVIDTISTVQFALPQAALDATLTATDVTVFDASKKVRVWFEATNSVSFRTAFSGKAVDVDHTITTTGGRRFNETIELKIREN